MLKNQNGLEYLALEFIKVTDVAAIAASKWIGRGKKKLADKAAVDAMRQALNQIDFRGEIVIGEGAKDESFELFIGEKVGRGKEPLLDIAVDPLECTSSVAFGRPNALTVIAAGPQNTLYKAIDSYMEKIAVGPEAAKIINLDAPVKDNLKKVAQALGKKIPEITVAVLDRPRHDELIKKIRSAGARVQLFTDGDIAMSIATCLPDSPIDILIGTGGSTEAVLSASALKCLGGNIICRWQPKDELHKKRLQVAGITNLKKVFAIDDLAKGNDLIFVATGVVSGPILDGVVSKYSKVITHSVVMSLNPRVIRFVSTHHI
ncbi:MAG: class II fructose-bisphosphatase [Candidatus Paceibacterota bacterium]|jgi:fructose-1,6-bisphosphatase II